MRSLRRRRSILSLHPRGQRHAYLRFAVPLRGPVRPILVRHEQAASIMADMYGRLTGRPGVVLGQGAFIGANAVFGTLEAHLAGSPMVVLADTTEGGDFSSNPRNASGWGHYGAFDLRNLLAGITKFSVLAATPKEAVLGVQMAIKHATTGGRDPPRWSCARRPSPASWIRTSRRECIRRNTGSTRLRPCRQWRPWSRPWSCCRLRSVP